MLSPAPGSNLSESPGPWQIYRRLLGSTGVGVVMQDVPEARVDAGTTSVRVYQDQTGGLAVVIAATAADEAHLTLTLNRTQLHTATARPPCPPGGGTPS